MRKITVKLDRERVLVFDFNDLIEFQQHTGIDFADVAATKKLHFKPADFRFLVWLCLRHEDPALSEADAGRLIRPSNIAALTQAFKGALESFFALPN